MSRPAIALLLVVQTLIGLTFALDISQNKRQQLDFTQKDIVPKTDVKALSAVNQRAAGFIGDLTVGQHYPDETVFRRVIEYNNPTNVVQSTALTLTVNNGVIHYISIINDPGSYSVACDSGYSIGSSRSNVNLRVPANSRASLTLIIAAH